MTLLTVKEAAKRVKRSVRTIERWIAGDDEHEPLPVIWLSNVRHIDETKLLAELRRRNLSDPSKARPASQLERTRRHLNRKYSGRL